MDQNLEIEFKNMLTKKEYLKIKSKEFSTSSDNNHVINQSNHYFDTKNQDLKSHDSALRIRKTDSFNELTLKSPSQGFLLETNVSLRDNEYSEILEAKQIKLSDYLSGLDFEEISKDSVVYLFNHFETKRFEKQVGAHLIVLDQTTYQNEEIDYELEVESMDAVKGKEFFVSFLSKNSIPFRPAKPKIARAVEKAQSFS